MEEQVENHADIFTSFPLVSVIHDILTVATYLLITTKHKETRPGMVKVRIS